MYWISIGNNIQIEIYEHQINTCICLWITVVPICQLLLLLVCAPSREPFPQSSALQPMLPVVWSLQRVPARLQLLTVGLVGRARNPSTLTVWCIYSGSGLSCRRAKCARLAQRSLALCRQQLPHRCEGSPWQCASIYPRIRSAGPLAVLRSTLTPARLPAVWSWCRSWQPGR